jgi:hypothetical protein
MLIFKYFILIIKSILFTVHCFHVYSNLRFVKTDRTNNNNKTPYLKSRDRVYLRNDVDLLDYTLRSKDINFMIDNKLFHEVVGHEEKIDKNDEVFYYLFYFTI